LPRSGIAVGVHRIGFSTKLQPQNAIYPIEINGIIIDAGRVGDRVPSQMARVKAAARW
jgi:hypothetical protein